jgi:hypothetical protein
MCFSGVTDPNSLRGPCWEYMHAYTCSPLYLLLFICVYILKIMDLYGQLQFQFNTYRLILPFFMFNFPLWQFQTWCQLPFMHLLIGSLPVYNQSLISASILPTWTHSSSSITHCAASPYRSHSQITWLHVWINSPYLGTDTHAGAALLCWHPHSVWGPASCPGPLWSSTVWILYCLVYLMALAWIVLKGKGRKVKEKRRSTQSNCNRSFSPEIDPVCPVCPGAANTNYFAPLNYQDLNRINQLTISSCLLIITDSKYNLFSRTQHTWNI